MSRQRKTKKQKIKSTERLEQAGFKLKQEWLVSKKISDVRPETNKFEAKYFKLDLTKTFVLTMLVLALELALWQYLSRQ